VSRRPLRRGALVGEVAKRLFLDTSGKNSISDRPSTSCNRNSYQSELKSNRYLASLGTQDAIVRTFVLLSEIKGTGLHATNEQSITKILIFNPKIMATDGGKEASPPDGGHPHPLSRCAILMGRIGITAPSNHGNFSPHCIVATSPHRPK
jgi:hypothetical protein